MVIRGHRGDDIQNVNRTNQSDLVSRKTDPRTFEDCTRGMHAAAEPRRNFSAVEWTFDMLFCPWILVRELRFGDGRPPPRIRIRCILLNMDRCIIAVAISRAWPHVLVGSTIAALTDRQSVVFF